MISLTKSFRTITVATFVLVCATQTVWGWGESRPRAIGMGGAYTALARGLEAPYWNPANLGLSDGESFSLNLVDIGLSVKNNGFSLSDYNKYTGKFLTEADKQDILNSIPVNGLNLDISTEASTLNLSIGNLALTCKGYAASTLNLPKDPFELLLYGNAVKKELSFESIKGEGYGLADAALSYGIALKKWKTGELSTGASFHYLQGLAYEKVMKSEGGVVTTDTGFVGSGNLLLRSSLGGSGYAADIGLAVRFEDDWYFSASWQNLYSKITWNTETEATLFAFEMEPITADGMSEDESDSLVTSSDTTYTIGNFSSDLPSVIKLGLAKKYKKLVWALDYEQGLFDRPAFGVNPKLSCGAEYSLVGFFPIRFGASFGGKQGSVYSTGFGLHFGPYHVDMALANAGSPLPSHTKGLKFAFGMGLYF